VIFSEKRQGTLLFFLGELGPKKNHKFSLKKKMEEFWGFLGEWIFEPPGPYGLGISAEISLWKWGVGESCL